MSEKEVILKLRDSIYAESINSYIEIARENKLKISMYIEVPDNSEISKLPKEAYVNGLLYVDFDFGADQTWLTDQIVVDKGMFSTILVYPGPDGWQEYPVSFPCLLILGIVGLDDVKPRTVNFSITKEDKEFQLKVQNSKTKLRLVKSWER